MVIQKTGVELQLRKLEQGFQIENPLASRMSAAMLGRELASLALEGLEAFKTADKRLTAIVERLIGQEMGAVAGAVERAFHDGVATGAKENDVLRANKESKKERGI